MPHCRETSGESFVLWGVAEHDLPVDDQTRALFYVAERASAFKMRVLVPGVILGLILGYFGADAVSASHRVSMVVLAFLGPVLASAFMSAGLVELLMPRRARQWMVEALVLFRVRREPLVAGVRKAVLDS